MIFLKLFLSFCYIGALSFGGGYAALPLIREQCVDLNAWLSMAEFSDLLTISQITPGPIAINSATFVGMKTAGIPGAVVASIGFMLPPFIIVTLIFLIFKKYGRLPLLQDILSGLKPAVVALIAVAGMDILFEAVWGSQAISLASTDIFTAALAVMAFTVMRIRKTGAISVILVCGIIGVLQHFVTGLLL
ncbi:MAG: chromate transporter [Clostridiales bacterium]|mgnify:FL=1|jgi:chromate transporter|nr:chromate transporter [Clostridiales bacterium]